jgi:hypothetical protein
MRPTNGEEANAARRLDLPRDCSLASGTVSGNATNPKITQLNAARDRLEVWIALLTLLDRLRARVGRALGDYESEMIHDEALVAELTEQVETFSRFAAHFHRGRRP